MSKVQIVSVVRDKEMYRRCILNNPNTGGCETLCIDNTVENLSIPARYNSFIESLPHDSDRWLIFCHEDWEPLCNIASLVERLDRNCLYGPIGVLIERNGIFDCLHIRGRVHQTKKDGRNSLHITGDSLEGPVDTLDCQCLIIHSSLLESKGLRFDENLDFHMYVEDFCAQAKERFGIESRTVNLPCRHCSYGKTRGSFKEALTYMQSKYAGCPHRYPTIVGHCNSFGGDSRRILVKRRPSFIFKQARLIKKLFSK